MKFKDYINESGLSRLWDHNKNYDCGTITAFRNARDCGDGKKYSKKENKARNKSLLAKLMFSGYSVTKVKGVYIENYGSSDAIEVGENVFFVVDIKEKGNLKKDLKKLGEEFDQDSILFIPKGGKDGFLIGTNHCINGYPGYGVVKKLKNPVFGEKGEFYTKIKGRPFTLKEDVEFIHLPQNNMGKWAMSMASRQKWEELIEN